VEKRALVALFRIQDPKKFYALNLTIIAPWALINEPLSNITITSLIVHFDPRVAPVALGFF
jgi:hypothetical protein